MGGSIEELLGPGEPMNSRKYLPGDAMHVSLFCGNPIIEVMKF